MNRFYDSENNRLVYINHKAGDQFWDSHWDKYDIRKMIQSVVFNRLILVPTRKYLPIGSRVLEGGCGLGQNVWSLHKHGYETYGVDYAAETVQKINNALPDLKVTCQDIRHLDFEDEFFDGYWSLGVIEHFYDGYDDIVMEMKRVIKPGGFLFLTFPCMSKFRKYKVGRGRYLLWREEEDLIQSFYQFALSADSVESKVSEKGFQLIQKQSISGLKGFKDELETPLLKKSLQRLYDSKGLFQRAAAWGMDHLLSPFAGHCELMIFKCLA